MESILILIGLVIVIFFVYRQLNYHERFFTFIVLADTQMYSAKYPQIFLSQVNWIKENKEKLNIEFVSHVGDIVFHNSENKTQWEIASKCMAVLEGIVPYGILPGNHDSDEYSNDKITFNKYNSVFSPERFKKFSWYGGNYLGNQNNFQLIEADSLKMIILNLQFDPSDNIIHWANKILKLHADRTAIVVTHGYIYDDIPYRSDISYYGKESNSGEDMWHKLIKNNCNVLLVLSGHYHTNTGENYLRSINRCGEKVHQIVQNYQHLENGGNGFLRIYKFKPTKKQIDVLTYSPYLDKYRKGKRSNFTIRY